MNKIEGLQNSQSALEKLAAQRCLYSEAKRIFFFRASVAIVIAVLFPFLRKAYPGLTNWLAILATAYLLLDIFVLDNVESEKRRNGAKTQESFDVEVLGIKWNPIVADEKPDHEDTGRCLLKVEKNGFDAFRDWYPKNISQLPQDVARTLCQRANVWWDSNLRRLYAHFLLLILLALAVFVFWFNKDEPVIKATVFFASFLPLFKLLVEQNISHRKAARRLDTLKTQLQGLLDGVLADPNTEIEESTTRSIQDEIYRHRKSVTSIPDFFYAPLKARYEHLMSFNAKKFSDEYISRTSRA